MVIRPPTVEHLVTLNNVGAIFRLAAALGVDAVLVTPRCADPLYRRSVRVSMGTVFQVPWTRIDPWPASVSDLHGQGWTVASLALSDDSISLDELIERAPERLMLVLGAEGDGLTRRTVAMSDLVVRIPMAGGVDSLNVAAASAVALWATRPRSAAVAASAGGLRWKCTLADSCAAAGAAGLRLQWSCTL